MSRDQYEPVAVSRRIDAPAELIFRVLADPGMHTALDGTGMLRGAVTTDPVSRIGDVFVMKMYFVRLGDYEMNNHVVEFEAGLADRLGTGGRPRAPGRRAGQHRAGPLGPAVEL